MRKICVDQSELKLKISVWKKLALSKQMLISAATNSLGLDPECSMDEFKKELDKAIAKGIRADKDINQAQEEAKNAITEMEGKVERNEQALKEAEQTKDAALKAKVAMEKGVTAAREANAKELKKVNAQLAEKEKLLKSIKIALADSPENVARKLKNLKKEKLDESTARKRAEDTVRSLKKDKQNLQKEQKQLKKLIEHSLKLVEKHKQLHEISVTQHGKLMELAKDDKKIDSIPALDEELIEEITTNVGKEKPKVDSAGKIGKKGVKRKSYETTPWLSLLK